jgi:isopentenyl diphosphate isomerase/L-lactate dehydrogenase-like FMN-dependent dehydrogenase
VPRVLRDVGQIDTSTTFLGLPLALPVMIAPMGSMFLLHPDGDLGMARGAVRAGTVAWLSTMTRWTPEEVAGAATGPLIFQLYWRGDNAWAEALIRRVEAAGFKGLALTVDTPAYGRRERDIEKRYDPRGQGSRLWQGFPPPAQGDARMAALGWDDVDWLVSTTKLPVIIKGIMTPEDAVLAVEHGARCVYISNHGGRQLDYAPAPIEILAEIAEAVAGRAEIVIDCGVQRGTDVLKAIALGANAVAIGKLAAWGLAAAGEDGVARVLELLHTELRIAMANTGQTDIKRVGPDLVRRVCTCE